MSLDCLAPKDQLIVSLFWSCQVASGAAGWAPRSPPLASRAGPCCSVARCRRHQASRLLRPLRRTHTAGCPCWSSGHSWPPLDCSAEAVGWAVAVAATATVVAVDRRQSQWLRRDCGPACPRCGGGRGGDHRGGLPHPHRTAYPHPWCHRRRRHHHPPRRDWVKRIFR